MGMVGLRGDVLVVGPPSNFHQHHESVLSDHQINSNSNNTTALGVGIIPLLTAAPCLPPIEDGSDRGRAGFHLWQNQQQFHANYLKKPGMMEAVNTGCGGNLNSGNPGAIGGSGGSALGATTCQDCGNQAKKDCSHRRCRTCCKSRGFDCSTHVKSTWVPAARRRERQLSGAAAGSSSTSTTKKPRLISSQTTTSHTSNSNTTPPRSFDTSSSHQDATFRDTLPGHIRAPAVFKCVRVTAIDDGEDEYAYQAVVKIGGHVFKGFLYDQGALDEREAFPNISELHLGASSGSGGVGGRIGGSSSSPVIDPSDVYGPPGGGLLGTTAYGNQIS